MGLTSYRWPRLPVAEPSSSSTPEKGLLRFNQPTQRIGLILLERLALKKLVPRQNLWVGLAEKPRKPLITHGLWLAKRSLF